MLQVTTVGQKCGLPVLPGTWGLWAAPSSRARCVSNRMRRKTAGGRSRSDTTTAPLGGGLPSTWPV